MGVGKFEAWKAIKEAWTLLIGSRRTFVYMTLSVGIVTWLVSNLFLGWVLPPAEPEMTALSNGDVMPLLRNEGPIVDLSVGGLSFGVGATTAYPWVERFAEAVISALFAGAFVAYALRRAVELEVRYAMLADYIRFFPTFLLLEVLAFAAFFVLAQLGGLVVLLATVVGGVAFAFVQFYVVDRDAGVGEALQGSIRVVNSNLGQTVLLLFTGAVLGFLVNTPLMLAGMFLPTAVTVVAGIVSGLASILLTALMSVALACAFRDAVGIYTAGGELPIETGHPGAALSTRA